jgi:hypothetical protein
VGKAGTWSFLTTATSRVSKLALLTTGPSGGIDRLEVGMTVRLHAVIFSAVLLAAPAVLRGEEVVVPAGTILQCTLSEPNLSSKTAEAGDPVLCDAGPLYVFGVPVLPRGAYLEGHFTDSREPGHFWGKGWMQLDFDKILLPGAEIPLSTKVTRERSMEPVMQPGMPWSGRFQSCGRRRLSLFHFGARAQR